MNTTSQAPAVPVAVTRKLQLVRRRKMRIQAASAGVAAAAVLLTAMGIAMLIDWLATLYDVRWRTALTVAALSMAAATIAAWLLIAWRRSLRWDRVALDVDRQIPQMEERWSTVTHVSVNGEGPAVVHPAMLRKVAAEAAGWEPHVDPQQVVSTSTLGRALTGLTLVAAALTIAALFNSERMIVLLRRFWSPASSISATELVDMSGNLVVGKGEPVELTAAVKGVPVRQAILFMRPDDESDQTVRLVAHGEDPIAFSHRLRDVEQPFRYRFRAGDGQTGWFKVDVAERPEIQAVRMTVTPPAYTGRPATIFDKFPRRIATLVNSELELAVRSTIALSSLKLQLGDEQAVEMTAGDDGWYRWKTTLKQTVSLSPLLTETHGLTNVRAPKSQINVVPDSPPIVKIVSPDDQAAVRPDDTIEIAFTAKDDVGIGSAELVVYDESNPDEGQVPLATIPIPLDDERGARDVEGKVNLDLTKFAVTDGARIGYEVRVTESRDPEVNAAAIGKPSNRKPSAERSKAGERTTAAASPAEGSKASTSTSKPSSERPAGESTTTAQTTTATSEKSNDGNAPGSANSQQPLAQNASSPPSAKSIASGEAEQKAADQAMSKPNSLETQPNSAASSTENSTPPMADSARVATSQRQSLDPASANSASQAAGESSNRAAGKAEPQSTLAAPSPPTKSSSSGDSPPPNDMQKRGLDVAQAASSQRMRLQVDEWAGSFDGQQRQKLEMAIAPDLAALDEALAHAQENARSVLDEIGAKAEWRPKHDRDVTNADRATVDAQQIIRKLEQRTKGTPYAFIGLQLSDIGAAHVNPARNNFWTALQLDGGGRVQAVRDGWQHVTRAGQLLADLDAQFQRAQREFELADKLQQVKKMYQVFIENSFQLLNGKPGDPDRYPHDMAELKLDDEYLKRLREVLEMRRDMMAELARILAQDPRLLQRFMDLFKNRAENLRETLAALTAEQKDLNREVLAWTLVDDAERPRIAQALFQRKLREAGELATAAGELQDRYQTWLPLAKEAKDKDLEAATKAIQETANAANELSEKANAMVTQMDRVRLKSDVNPPAATGTKATATAPADAANSDANKAFVDMRAVADALAAQLRELEIALRQLSSRQDNPEIAVFAGTRLVEARKLIATTTAWMREVDLQKENNFATAAAVAQHRLAEVTERLAEKLADIEQTLVGLLQRRDGKLPEAIAEKARAFMMALDNQAAPNQMAAMAAAPARNQLPRATERQQAAYDGLVAAEKAYDEMMRLAVKEIDKLPVQDPIAQLLNDPTLDELLAALEQEIPLEDLLGINPRPSNLQIVGDWMRPGNGSGSGMGSGSGSGQGMAQNQVRQRGRQAQQRLDRSYRAAVARALKESQERKAVVVPQPTITINWNKLVSELGDDLQQGRDKAPPEQYRRPIEQYFDVISRAAADGRRSDQ